MNRRSFLKFIGIAPAASIIPGASIKTLAEKIQEQVLNPEDIVKNPDRERMDLNDDITGMAAHFTLHLCWEWLDIEKNQTAENIIAMFKFSVTQSSMIGLLIAKKATRTFMNMADKDVKIKLLDHEAFGIVVNRWDSLISGKLPIGQYEHLKNKLGIKGTI